MDDKYHRMDGNAIRRPRETGSRSGAMEDHDSQPSQRRWHLMMITSVGPVIFRFKKSNFPFQKSEIPFRFRFIIGNVEFDEITIKYRKKVR